MRRFAIRLANRLGFSKVDDLLDQLTPSEFRERYAHYLIEPWGDEWEQTGMIAAQLNNIFAMYCAGKSGKAVHEAALKDSEDYIPVYTIGQTKSRERKRRQQSADEMAARLTGLVKKNGK